MHSVLKIVSEFDKQVRRALGDDYQRVIDLNRNGDGECHLGEFCNPDELMDWAFTLAVGHKPQRPLDPTDQTITSDYDLIGVAYDEWHRLTNPTES